MFEDYDDYYKILGVPRNATLDEIKKAYRELVMKYHPDINKSKEAEEKMRKINEAYAVLSDPEKRRQYDMLGSNQFNQQFSPEDIFRGFDIESVLRDIGLDEDFSDIFSDIANLRAVEHYNNIFNNFVNKPEPEDIHKTLVVSKSELLNGAYKKITVKHKEICPVCGGTGINRQERRIGTTFEFITKTCQMCGGTGCLYKTHIISFEIPKNSYDGKVLRLKGMGNCGGNLYIELKEAP